jgi:hypothetical protein
LVPARMHEAQQQPQTAFTQNCAIVTKAGTHCDAH